MRLTLYVACGLAAIAILMAIAGAMLPRDHVATRRAKFRKSQEEVFALISGPQDWRPDVSKWERIDEKRFAEFDASGERMLMEEVENVPPKRRVTRIADESLPFGGTWTWELQPTEDGGCIARVTENGFVKNPVFRFIARYFMGYHSTMEKYLVNLGNKLGQHSLEIEE